MAGIIPSTLISLGILNLYNIYTKLILYNYNYINNLIN